MVLSPCLLAATIAAPLAYACRSSIERRAHRADVCPACGYSLVGLGPHEKRCPECGSLPSNDPIPRYRQSLVAVLWPLVIGPVGFAIFACFSPDLFPARSISLLFWLTWPYFVLCGVLSIARWQRLPRLAWWTSISISVAVTCLYLIEMPRIARGVSGEYGIDFDFQVGIPVMGGVSAIMICAVIAAVSLGCLMTPRLVRCWAKLRP